MWRSPERLVSFSSLLVPCSAGGHARCLPPGKRVMGGAGALTPCWSVAHPSPRACSSPPLVTPARRWCAGCLVLEPWPCATWRGSAAVLRVASPPPVVVLPARWHGAGGTSGGDHRQALVRRAGREQQHGHAGVLVAAGLGQLVMEPQPIAAGGGGQVYRGVYAGGTAAIKSPVVSHGALTEAHSTHPSRSPVRARHPGIQPALPPSAASG